MIHILLLLAVLGLLIRVTVQCRWIERDLMDMTAQLEDLKRQTEYEREKKQVTMWD